MGINWFPSISPSYRLGEMFRAIVSWLGLVIIVHYVYFIGFRLILWSLSYILTMSSKELPDHQKDTCMKLQRGLYHAFQELHTFSVWQANTTAVSSWKTCLNLCFVLCVLFYSPVERQIHRHTSYGEVLGDLSHCKASNFCNVDHLY